jgi:hypothetical protein
MKILSVVILLTLAQSCLSQTSAETSSFFIKDANGRYVDFKSSQGVEGSPFYSDNYTAARLTLGANTYYINKVKLNLSENIIIFENEGKDMVPSIPVDKVEFFDENTNEYRLKFKKGFPNAGKNSLQTYYQVLDSGKATLLQYLGIRSRETRPYNSATTITVYEKEKSYFLFIKNNMYLIKKTGDLLEAMKDKKAEVQSFISSKKIKVNKEEDLKALVAFYNKLV